MPRYAAILFDLDGTLVDTITLYERAVLEAFARRGMHITHEQFHDWYMRPWHLGDMLRFFGKTEDEVTAIRAERDERYEALLRSEVEWLHGAEDLLTSVVSRYPAAVITGSWLSYVDAIDEKLDVRKYIGRFVTADDTGKFMKPHPHGLLLAAEALKVDPADCLYVGDQRFDVEAATAAGMPSILYRGPWTPHDAGADAILQTSSLAEVQAHINE